MIKKDIRSDFLKNKNFYQEKYIRLYYSDLGDFFDMITNQAQRSVNLPQIIDLNEVLPRLRAFFQRSQKNWNDSNVVFTNYFKSIPEIYSTFAIGDGIEFIFEDGQGDGFNEFWKENKMSKVLKRAFEKTLAAGYDGGFFRMEDGKPVFQEIGFQNFYPVEKAIFGYSDKELNLVWILREEESFSKNYAYVINYKEDNGKVTITHKVYNYSSSAGFASENKEKLSLIDTDGVLGEDGTEENTFTSIPVVMMNNIKQDRNNFGESIYKDIVGHVQDLSICESSASMEIEEFFGSKMAIPESAVTKKSDGTAKMKSNDYFVVGANSIIPSYITKGNPNFDHLFKKMAETKKDISTITKIPIEILDETQGGNQKVELAKIRLQPFVREVESYRDMINDFINGVAKIYYESVGAEPEEFEIKYGEIIETDSTVIKKDLREEVADEIISKKRYLRETRSDLDEESIDAILAEVKDEAGDDVQVGAGDLTADIGDRL